MRQQQKSLIVPVSVHNEKNTPSTTNLVRVSQKLGYRGDNGIDVQANAPRNR